MLYCAPWLDHPEAYSPGHATPSAGEDPTVLDAAVGSNPLRLRCTADPAAADGLYCGVTDFGSNELFVYRGSCSGLARIATIPGGDAPIGLALQAAEDGTLDAVFTGFKVWRENRLEHGLNLGGGMPLSLC